MSNYRRYYTAGGTYFFTVVTERRTPLFESETGRTLLGQTFRECQRRYPFQSLALVLLPDHLHSLWELPPDDIDYSGRWSWIKRTFTIAWLANGGLEQQRTAARERERRRSVWQRRFWEHQIVDEADFESHFDYIHYNPVKHGYVTSPRDWKWSTFHRYVAAGHYPPGWAKCAAVDLPGNAGE